MKPLFRVFSISGAWRVYGVNLEGEPISEHSEHSSLRAALIEADRANVMFGGIKSVALKAIKNLRISR